MNNSEPNKIVSRLYKEHLAIDKLPLGDDYNGRKNNLIEALLKISLVVGAIEVMNKKSLIKLVTMQSKYRFMKHHSFYLLFVKASEYIN